MQFGAVGALLVSESSNTVTEDQTRMKLTSFCHAERVSSVMETLIQFHLYIDSTNKKFKFRLSYLLNRVFIHLCICLSCLQVPKAGQESSTSQSSVCFTVHVTRNWHE